MELPDHDRLDKGVRVRVIRADMYDVRLRGVRAGDTGITVSSGAHPTVKFDRPELKQGLMMALQLEVIKEDTDGKIPDKISISTPPIDKR